MMARAIEILLAFTLIFSVSWGCENSQVDQVSARQGLDEYLNENLNFPNPWMSPYYYNIQSRVPFSAYANPYEGRIPLNRRPASGYFPKINPYEDNSQENRLAFGTLGANLFNTGLLTNLLTPAITWRPFANLVNRMEACTSPGGDAGVCTSASVCSSLSGRPSGSCTLGRVCCVNVITTCGSTVTMNNTYWQSPSTPVSTSSTCALTVKLDSKLVEQAASPICQIRLDLVSFTTAQPTAGTCTDTFQVSGAMTVAPIICGTNTGQHMYLDVPSSATSPTNVQLVFDFGTSTTTRSWNIKIAMLPCDATYLAPKDCLQYFTSVSGKVSSFNWQDVAATSTRQLNNQNYNICFRTEVVSGSRATQMCLTVCPVPNGGDAFSITTPAAVVTDGATAAAVVTTSADASSQSNVGTTVSSTGTSVFVVATCFYDFLQIAGGRDATTGIEADRFCGNALNPATGADLLNPGVTTSTQVCTAIRPFRMTFKTDGTEAAISTLFAPTVPVYAGVDTLNTGFCLDFKEK